MKQNQIIKDDIYYYFNAKYSRPRYIEVTTGENASMIEDLEADLEVKQYIEQRQDSLPQGFELSFWDDDSQVVKNRIATLTSNALQGNIRPM